MNDGLNQKKAQIEELSESVKSLEINLKKKNDDLEIAETKVTEQAK